jgi:site-specific recombinase XerD
VAHWRRKRAPVSIDIDGPLTPFLKSYAAFLNYLGYAHQTFLRKTWLVGQFNKWLRRKRISIGDVSIQHTERFLHGYSYSKQGDPATLNDLVAWLCKRGVVSSDAVSAPEQSELNLLVEEYSTYLLQERGLASTSIKDYTGIVRRFLIQSCPDGRSDLASLTARPICDFIVSEATRYKLSREASLLAVAVRSFLRFALHCGYIKTPLADAVPAVATHPLTSLPRALPHRNVRQVLSQSMRRRSPRGLRDYAILLLLARLGLRAREVMLLELGDVDWNNSCIHVSGKGRQEQPMPLPQDVGQAIATYLKNGRPKSSCRRLFLRAQAPWRGLASSAAISAIVKRALKRAGIRAATYGAHQFRHTLATNLLRNKISLPNISVVMRHRDPNTTRIYAKLDLKALREVAQPWPGRPL